MAERILILAFGNPARRDDALGPMVGEKIAGLHLTGVTVQIDYQLNVEDARDIADHEAVVFIDAAVEGPEPYAVRRVQPKADMPHSSHLSEPGALLALAKEIYGVDRPGFLLAIRGYDFGGFGERTSSRGQANAIAAAGDLGDLLAARTGQRVDALKTWSEEGTGQFAHSRKEAT